MAQPKIKVTALDTGSGASKVVSTDASGNVDITGTYSGVGSVFTGQSTASQLLVGDPGIETTGINIAGVTYQSSFKVSDIDGTRFAQTILHRHSTTLGPVIVGARSNSNTATHASVVPGQQLFSVYGAGYLATNYKLFGVVEIVASAQGSLSSTSSPGKLVFSTTPTGSVVPTQSLVIDQDKSVTIFGALTGITATFSGRTTHGGLYTPSLLPAFSATPSFDCATSNVFEPDALTADVTAITMTNEIGGQTVRIRFLQDGTGGWTVAVPTGAKIGGALELGANRVTWLVMTYSAQSLVWEGEWLVIPV